MKKILFLLAFVAAASIAANAQCSGKSASASGGKSCCASKMAKAAASDANIEKRVADDGAVSYVRKETDTEGNVRFVSVQFDEASNAFVNVAPKSACSADKAGMTKKAACTSAEKKACCASGHAAGKSCCAGKSAEKMEQ